MTEHKDVVLAMFGVSSGIAGLTLVFLGLVVASLQGFQPGTATDVLRPFRRPVLTVLAAFAASILCTTSAAAWLMDLGDNQPLYVATVVLFFAQLVLLVLAIGHVLKQSVWR